jgi:hypothetical protein
VTTYEEKFVNGRVHPLQGQRLLKQGELNRNPPKRLKEVTLKDLKVGLVLWHYTNCGVLWSHILRSRDEEPRTEQGSINYNKYKDYIKEGVINGQYFLGDYEVHSKIIKTKRRTSKAVT